MCIEYICCEILTIAVQHEQICDYSCEMSFYLIGFIATTSRFAVLQSLNLFHAFWMLRLHLDGGVS